MLRQLRHMRRLYPHRCWFRRKNGLREPVSERKLAPLIRVSAAEGDEHVEVCIRRQGPEQNCPCGSILDSFQIRQWLFRHPRGNDFCHHAPDTAVALDDRVKTGAKGSVEIRDIARKRKSLDCDVQQIATSL